MAQEERKIKSRLTKSTLGNLLSEKIKNGNLRPGELIKMSELLVELRGWKDPKVGKRTRNKSRHPERAADAELHDLVKEIEMEMKETN